MKSNHESVVVGFDGNVSKQSSKLGGRKRDLVGRQGNSRCGGHSVIKCIELYLIPE